MKKLFVCATAIGLFLSEPASAADDHHGDAHAAASHGGGSSAQTHATHTNAPARTMTGAFHSNIAPAHRNTPLHTTQTVMHNTTAATHQSHPVAAMKGGTDRKSGGQHASINSLRLNVQAQHQYHNGNYNQPQGYQARRWSYGERLPHAYFARDYWLTDYLDFGLFAPPDGLVWVRVGNDALLVDEISGDVVQVHYGVFY